MRFVRRREQVAPVRSRTHLVSRCRAHEVATFPYLPSASERPKHRSEAERNAGRSAGQAALRLNIRMFLFTEPTLLGLKLHGKIVIADGKQAIVGSINLSPGSFDSRRELAIQTRSKRVLKRLVQVSRRDWKHSRRIDLPDEGILADLEKHGSKGANVLVLGHSHT